MGQTTPLPSRSRPALLSHFKPPPSDAARPSQGLGRQRPRDPGGAPAVSRPCERDRARKGMLAFRALGARGLLPGECIAVACKSWSIPLLVGLALGATAAASRAGPLAGARMANEAANQGDARLERVVARHCWWQQGRRHCRGHIPARRPAITTCATPINCPSARRAGGKRCCARTVPATPVEAAGTRSRGSAGDRRALHSTAAAMTRRASELAPPSNRVPIRCSLAPPSRPAAGP